MATLLLLRHGQTTANTAGLLAGRGEAELDDLGRSQAIAAGKRLCELDLAAVVTSPLLRCRQTVALALPSAVPTVDESVIECDYGQWSGRSLAELVQEPLWAQVQQHPAAVTFPDGEAMAVMAARAVVGVRAWDRRISQEYGSGAAFLVCSHGDVIKAIVADALGLHLDLFQRIVIDPGSVSAIRYTDGRPFLTRLNDSTGPLVSAGSGGSDAVVGGDAGCAGAPGGAAAAVTAAPVRADRRGSAARTPTDG